MSKNIEVLILEFVNTSIDVIELCPHLYLICVCYEGLMRCGKSCRLRWINYLRPDVKRGNFTPEEEETITRLHKALGNKQVFLSQIIKIISYNVILPFLLILWT